jgi:hypothetical protein
LVPLVLGYNSLRLKNKRTVRSSLSLSTQNPADLVVGFKLGIVGNDCGPAFTPRLATSVASSASSSTAAFLLARSRAQFWTNREHGEANRQRTARAITLKKLRITGEER